ncbi:MAG TPA: hypothetical protein VJ728_16555, partial [Candidatus Binataceae bacterium]|nr:hypothetical protein [Candidatus Binataceae bacterium]
MKYRALGCLTQSAAVFCVVALVLMVFPLAANATNSASDVKTRQGLITGVIGEGVREFFGVPYAA